MIEIPIGGLGMNKQVNSCIEFVIFRANGGWTLFNSQKTGPGTVFTECENLIKECLIQVGLDPE